MIDATVFKFFSDLIYKKTGMIYQEKDSFRLESRLKQLLKLLEIETLEELHREFASKPNDRKLEQILVDLATNNETLFFRDKKPFDLITKHIMPRIIQNNPAGPIRVWSAACSTGQEIYSFIMALNEANLWHQIKNRISIEATDISKEALSYAKEGIYTGLEVQRGLPIQLLIKYFDQLDDKKWAIKSEFKSVIKFNEFNLLDMHLYKPSFYDIVLCRNVLIYQNVQNREKILNKVSDSLRPEGVLILGTGESLIGMNVRLGPETLDNMTVFKRAA